MNKKKIIIIVSAIVLAAIISVIVIFVVLKKDAYRILKVFEVEGQASVTRKDIGAIDPYNNMVLESGDTVALVKGVMMLQADEDKFISLEEDTELVLNAAGSSTNSKTTIELKKGTITNDIKNKLSNNSTYEVNTPNSTMSVRGTIFRVSVYEEDGVKYTKISVFEGKVASCLVYADGTISDEEVIIEKGNEVIIYENETTTAYLTAPKPIEYAKVPESVGEILDEAIDDGRDVAYDKNGEGFSGNTDNPSGETGKIVTVTFMYGDSVFGTQTVEAGSTASEPSLVPAQEGSWQWDFSDPVEEDITIKWE